MRVPFVGGSNPHRSVVVSAQRTINLYPSVDPEGKFTSAVYGRPGLNPQVFSSAGSSVVRGMAVFGSNLYAVVGGDLKKITTSGAVSTVGSLSSTTGPVGMAAGRTQLGIVDGTAGYYTTGSTLTTISDGDFPNGATHIVYLNDIFYVNDPSNAGRVHASDEGDVSSWAATAFATAQRDPDALAGLIAIQQQLLMVGAETTEAWADAGLTPFPLTPIAGAVTDVGAVAGFSLAKLTGEAFWLGRAKEGHGAAFRGGLVGTRISTAAVENAWASYSTISDALGFCFHMNGESFYVLTFPTADRTWVYHLNSRQWLEWNSYGLGRWRVNCHAFFNGKHLVGDYQDGNIYELSFDVYTDAGTVIERERWDRHILQADTRSVVTHDALEMDFEMGVGTATLDPQVMLSWSDDDGHVWSNRHWRGIGKVGEYRTRAVWRNLGTSRNRVYRWKMTDDCRTAVTAGFLTVEQMAV